jgi:stage V sporulation protein D (sporulation-specific penicillin-binding protein)
VEEGTGSGAYIEGYHIGGKTGTAEQGSINDDELAVSFIGYAEQEEAKVITLVIIDEPISDNPDIDPSSRLAVGLFKDIMEDVMPYMGIFPDIEPVEEEEALTTDETDVIGD